MIDILLDTVIDTLKLIPFLFVAFLIIEFFEHKLNEKSRDVIKKSGKFGSFFGALLGLLPNCGFSAFATNLYVTRVISLGSLIAIYLSTSDEMLPLLIAEKVEFSLIFKILLIKFLTGLFFGIIIDLFIKRKNDRQDYHICCDDHCDCEHGIVKSAVIHTLKIISFIFIIVFILNTLFEYFNLESFFINNLKDSFYLSFITSLIGLLPNCGASVIITELYLKNVIGFPAMLSGLLTGSGVALLVLFKTNKNIKENFKIVSLIYVIGVFVGLLFYLLGGF